MTTPVEVTTVVDAPVARVWEAFTDPAEVTQWNAASADWHCPHAESDLRDGGCFSYRMEARDGSEGFDFTGTYTAVIPGARLAYVMDDGRQVVVTFTAAAGGVRVSESFDPEEVYPREVQQAGWQAILDRFTAYVEATL